MTAKATILLDAADVRALKRRTGKADVSQALAALVNGLTPADGATARPVKRKAAKKAKPKAKKAPVKRKAPAKKKAAKKAQAKKPKLSKADFLARMAAGRAKAAKKRKK